MACASPSSDSSPAVAAARVQAPRSLYDPNYAESSWITDPGGYNYGPISLIPRTRDRIDAQYPGTQTGLHRMELRRRGRHQRRHRLGRRARASSGVRTSAWPPCGSSTATRATPTPPSGPSGTTTVKVRRSVTCRSGHVERPGHGSVYASTFAANPNKRVIVAINKSTSAKTAGIVVTCSAKLTKAKVYTITAGGGPNVVAQTDITPAATNAFRYSMPAMSVSVIVPE